MRLAVLGSISWRTPPAHYGPWETVVTNLTEGLVERGYDVTLYATQDSATEGRLRAVVPRPCSEDSTLDPKVWEYLHISQCLEEASSYDLIHNSLDFMPLTYSRLIQTPMVTTVHGFSLDQYRLVYRKYRESHFVSISDADRDPYLPYVRTVYNGIRVQDFRFFPKHGDYLAFVGRIHPEKGVHEAIEVARLAGLPLRIAGIIQDQSYFDAEVAPHVDGRSVEFIGPVGPADRDALLGQALALLHMTTIPERFGLVMAEAMANGTPVIGRALGSVSEVIDDGVTGFLVNTVEEAVAAVERVPTLDPSSCRRWVEQRFSVDAMVDGYLEVYRHILGDERVRPLQG
ncbi:MAG TPA: glycosyltransferase family 4 protein [Chloroflexota bacterium]|nr:glycosyltransferase family 4 protein [Chloroflexota bacterium]